jgi:hypothetical protein
VGAHNTVAKSTTKRAAKDSLGILRVLIHFHDCCSVDDKSVELSNEQEDEWKESWMRSNRHSDIRL